MIQESASLVQTVIRFSVKTLLSFEMTVTFYVIQISDYHYHYPLRFISFVTLVKKPVSKFAENGAESLNGKTNPSEPLLSRTPSFRLSEKYLSVTISNLL